MISDVHPTYTMGMVRRYILHPRKAIIGDTIISGTEVPKKMGNALPMRAV